MTNWREMEYGMHGLKGGGRGETGSKSRQRRTRYVGLKWARAEAGTEKITEKATEARGQAKVTRLIGKRQLRTQARNWATAGCGPSPVSNHEDKCGVPTGQPGQARAEA